MRVGDAPEQLVGQRAGPAHEVPAVPAQEPAQVDAHAPEPGDGHHEHPAGHRTEASRDDLMHQVEGHHAEHEARPREPVQHEHVVPARHDVAHAAEVQEVGEDVRGVGEERQPHQRGQHDEHPQHRPARGRQAERDGGEHERHPGEDEVPQQEPVVIGVRVPGARGDERDAHERRRHEQPHDGVGEAVPAAGAREARLDRRSGARGAGRLRGGRRRGGDSAGAVGADAPGAGSRRTAPSNGPGEPGSRALTRPPGAGTARPRRRGPASGPRVRAHRSRARGRRRPAGARRPP